MTEFKKVIATAAVALCTTTATAETLVFGVLMKSLSQPYWASMELGIKESTKNAEVDYYLQTSDSDINPEQQLKACTTMLQRRPNIMITAAVDPTALIPCVAKANELNIPFIDLDHTVAKDSNVDIAFSIGADHIAVGNQMAAHIAEQLGADASGKVLVLKGAADSQTSQQHSTGFAQGLAQSAPDLKIVAALNVNGDRAKAKDITSNIINQHDNLKIIFATEDTVALGATDAVFAANKDEDIIVIGVNGDSEAIKSGKLQASIATLPYLVGTQVVEKASELLAGHSIEGAVATPSVILTKDIFESGTDPMLAFIK